MGIHEVVAIIVFLGTCSAKFEPFIVNGRDASIEDFPFIAFIVYYDKKDELACVCGGSLLSSQSILTAAHCLDDPTRKKQFRFKRVDVMMGHNEWRKSTMIRQSVDYETHPEYDMTSTEFDIGVLFLTSPVKFSRTVKKTVLQRTPLEYPRQKHLLAAGWGAWSDPVNTSYILSEKLQYLAHELVPSDICSKKNNFSLEAGTMCATSLSDRKFVFGGDSGGPLVTQDGYQVGLVSYKLEENSHGVTIFTHIPDYLDWIEKTQNQLFAKYCPAKLRIRISAKRNKSKSFYLN